MLKRVTITFLCLSVACLISLRSQAGSWFMGKLGFSEAVNTSPALNAVQQIQPAPSKPPLRSIRLTITPTGFEPKEMRFPKGPILLLFDNQTGLRDLTINTADESKKAIQLSRMSQGKHRLKQAVNFPPGRYELIEQGHPEWKCVLEVTPQ